MPKCNVNKICMFSIFNFASRPETKSGIGVFDEREPKCDILNIIYFIFDPVSRRIEKVMRSNSGILMGSFAPSSW